MGTGHVKKIGTPTHDNIVPHGVMNQVLANIVCPCNPGNLCKNKGLPSAQTWRARNFPI